MSLASFLSISTRDRNKDFLCIFFSAVLYGLGFLIPNYFWWMTVTGCAMMLSVLIRKTDRWLLFIWPIIVFTMLTAIFMAPLYHHVLSLRIYFLFGWAALVLYMAVCFFIWAIVCRYVLLKQRNTFLRFLCSFTFLYVFVRFFDVCFLFPFGVVEGCRCFHPLVPSMATGIFRFLITIFGELWLTCFFCYTVACIAFRKFWLFFLSIFFVGFVFYWSTNSVSHTDDFSLCEKINKICVASIPYSVSGSCSCDRCIHDFAQSMSTLASNSCLYDAVVMPESTVPYTLENKRISHALLQATVRTPRIFFGGYSGQTHTCANACFCIDRNTLKHVYTKKHRVMFVERIPRFFDFVSRAWFLGDSSMFCAGKAERPIINVAGIDCFPVMCSELFFGQFSSDFIPDYGKSNRCALCLVNDSWFGFIGKRLMVYAGLFSCLQEGYPCLYCSYNYALYCSSFGCLYELATCRLNKISYRGRN